MGLVIANGEACFLAKEFATLTGETMAGRTPSHRTNGWNVSSVTAAWKSETGNSAPS